MTGTTGVAGHTDASAREWWELLAQGRLCLQRCTGCDTTQHPPGPVCRSCHRRDHLAFVDHDRRAQLVSATRVQQSPHPAFADRVPYWLTLVHLGCGAHTLALLPDQPTGVALAPGRTGTVQPGQVDGSPVLTFYPDTAVGAQAAGEPDTTADVDDSGTRAGAHYD